VSRVDGIGSMGSLSALRGAAVESGCSDSATFLRR